MGLLTVTELGTRNWLLVHHNVSLVFVDVIQSVNTKSSSICNVTVQLAPNGKMINHIGCSLLYISSVVVVQYMRIPTSTLELLWY